MTNSIIKNEAAKREYFNHCRSAKGFAESTINKYAQCIYKWQVCFENSDFAEFDRDLCDEFKKYLKREADKNNTSLSNQYDILRHTKRFFLWLSDQPFYDKIKKTDLDYLRLSKKETSIALEKTEKDIPTLEEIKSIVQSISGNHEVALRDRAMIAFLILTGMRISAVVSLPMQAFDKHKLHIEQSPAMGVKTKNSKKIISTFFPIGWDDGERIFLEWYSYLTEEKGFGSKKPIFPATQDFSLKKVSDEFWQSSNPARKIIQERCKEANVPYYNPHSFRHSAVAFMSELGLTEADKRAISLVLGHEHIGTTFGSYGYGSLTPIEAVERVKAMKNLKNNGLSINISNEELGKAVRNALLIK
ncbi:MAG: tyrosine-type recombinase/integrase [Parcubacteria group bacterium]|jgi:integrase